MDKKVLIDILQNLKGQIHIFIIDPVIRHRYEEAIGNALEIIKKYKN
tara:strand:- start:2486 stop:2626 length:141 start_codon:yes stop_codon:yes gene_type:complete